ncbi:MAG: hypothetical protein P4L93_08355 [Coriobacteriia bacterium]|nr:hypothetical protein [Coriobacteriia bacterium]
MTADSAAELTSPEPRDRARALIERGISRLDTGERDSAMNDFLEAERVAAETGLDGLVRTSRINQGYVYTVEGDSESAARLYEQAADLSREADDTERLSLALANLSVELKEQGRNEDAITALSEYLGLLGDDAAAAAAEAYLSRATCLVELGDHQAAFVDLDEAEVAAAEADDQSLRYMVRMSQGGVYVRIGDLMAARIVFEQAMDLALAAGDKAAIQEARVSLAQVCRLIGLADQAEGLYEEAEIQYREEGNSTALADALYWHGVVLASQKRVEPALAKWREEEAIRRERGQDGHVAESLYAQADVLSGAGDHEAANPLFHEAVELLETLNMADDLPVVLYEYGMSLREADKPAEALNRADEAVRLAAVKGDPIVERRAQSLRAMALADLGQIADAQAAIDAAESLCADALAHSAMVWTLARRAYVLACDAGEPDDVVSALKAAHEYAMMHGEFAVSRTAVRRIAEEINSQCGETYARPIEAFRHSQLEELNRSVNAGMPRNVTTHPEEVEVPTAVLPDDEEFESSSQEE